MGWLSDVVSSVTSPVVDVVKSVASPVVGAVRGVTGGLAGGVENLTGLNLSNPATLAALGLAAYGYMNPEMFGTAGAGSELGAEAVTSPVATGNVAATDLGTLATTSAGQASNIIPAAAAPAAEGLSPIVAGNVGSYGPVAGVEAGVTGAGAAGTTAAAEPWTLNQLGNTVATGAKDLGNYIMNNKLQSAMIGSSLYDMYAKNQMAKQLQKQREQQMAQIESFYAPGSPEYARMENEAKRAAAAAGRSFDSTQFQAELAGRMADRKMAAMQSAQTGSNQLLAGQMNNQYGGLNTLFNNLAMYQIMQQRGLVK